MSKPDTSPAWHPRYKLIQWSAALILLLLLLGGFLLGQFKPPMGQLAFCAFGVFTGAAFARMSHPSNRELTRLGQISLGFVAASQVFYQMLVWSEPWRVLSSAIGWRLWWATVVTAVGLGWLQVLWRAGARWKWNSGRTTLGFTVALGLLMVGQIFIAKPLTFPKWWIITSGVLALGMVGGSLVIIGRWLRDRPKSTRPLPPWMKPTLYACGSMALCVGSFYIGRLTVPTTSPFDSTPMTLKTMSTVEVDKQIAGDWEILHEKANLLGLPPPPSKARLGLLGRMRGKHDEINKNMTAEGRSSYSQEENDHIREQYLEYLKHRDRLIRMAALYSAYETLPDKKRREQAFLLGYCAAVTAMDVGQEFVVLFLNKRRARAKFNEPSKDGREAGQFELVYESVTATRHMKKLGKYRKFYSTHSARWLEESKRQKEESVFNKERFNWVIKQIHDGNKSINKSIKKEELDPLRAWFERLRWRLESNAYKRVVYGATRLAANLVGDTRIVQREQFISVALVQQAVQEKNLQPGDIILTRRNWHLSNAFLPGFWPHAALYVGTEKQLKELGITDKNAGVGWEDYKNEQEGHPRVILEAVGEGVRFHSAEYTLNADYVMVLRPRFPRLLDPEDKKGALKKALLKAFTEYHGLPYDFDFDFVDEHKIVCSELIYRIYSKELDFDWETVVGKEVVSPLSIARRFKRELGSDKAQFEFVMFLDKVPGENRADFSTLDAALESIDRPKAFNE
ncbi:MAG: YiiX/YebB-like N1pC/P60 family cysteine hydrolase [Verrucomicrobiota bacterium]|jgi:hypothetical protein|nr:YiiX/YebB-like N1pC/P60 family cysteine hydrolase [Verrucomicrobiota bacterium]